MVLQLRKKYLEAISVSSASLSLSNIVSFYYNYTKENADKIKGQLDRNGYFLLKNKISTGNNKSTTRDIYISAYFTDVNREADCNRMLQQKYHNGSIDIKTTAGFFSPTTNELVIIVAIYDINDIEKSIKKADIRSTIEHEITHAFDHTNKNSKLADQNGVPGVGENFLLACIHLGCATNSEIASLMRSDLLNLGSTSECIYAISVILYKLFALTEFNAHQMSDLKETHKVNLKKSAAVRKALIKDINADAAVTREMLSKSTKITPDELPQLWTIIGRVLNYMGYTVNSKSPDAVYKYFSNKSIMLFNKFYQKKLKNQVKYIISLKEKANIKSNLVKCIKKNKMNTGISFWFSPTGSTDSFLCRIHTVNDRISLTMNHKEQPIVGNADDIYSRILDARITGGAEFDFAVDNLVDIIIQSLERAFNNIPYDPVYDITIPQDEEQSYKSNKISSRFADLDWD